MGRDPERAAGSRPATETQVDFAPNETAARFVSHDAALVLDAPVAIYSVDLEGIVLSWNRAAEGLFGWKAAEIIGSPVPFIPADEMHKAVAARGRLLAGESITSTEYCPLTRNGEPKHVLTSASLVRDDEGAPCAIIAFALDVTEKHRSEQAVARAEHKWRLLLQSTSDTVTLVDGEGRIRQTSGEFDDVLGYAMEWWPGQLTFDLIHPDDRPRATAAFADVLAHPGDSFTEVLRTRHAHGHWDLIEYTAVNRLDDPLVESVVITSRNVTDVTQAEAMLADEAKILELIARGAPMDETLDAIASMVDYHTGGVSGVFLLDANGTKLSACAAPAMQADLIAAARESVVARGERLFIGRDEPTECRDFADEVGSLHADYLLSIGYRSGWSVPIRPTLGGDVLGTLAVLYGVSREPTARERNVVDVASHLSAIAVEQHRAHHHLEHRARHDQLTNLPNRWAIVERVDDAIARVRGTGRSTAVLLLDLDRFKVVNDSLGHAAGDALLVAFGNRLQAVAGEDAFVGHFGGDEFVVVIDDVEDLEHVHATASRIDLALTEPFVIEPSPDDGGHELFLSASIGVALATNGDGAHEVLQHADAAMYRAKDRGRDRLEVFDEELQTRATELLRVDRELRLAVERAELTLHYQPKVDLCSGRIFGVEALLRWTHPERGIVLPSDFIGVAEETGLIVRIGKWVLEEAVRQARAWVDRLGIDRLSVAVNLSARQLTTPGLDVTVARVLSRYDWPPEDLTLELTESILIDDADATLGVLQALKELGVMLAIDDFGTGYSSLSYLHRFPVDIVKVDRTFVSPLSADGEGSAVATAVLHMAHALGLIASAEGVEEATQLAGLRALGCDWAQGFLFARPLPADDVAALLADGPTW